MENKLLSIYFVLFTYFKSLCGENFKYSDHQLDIETMSVQFRLVKIQIRIQIQVIFEFSCFPFPVSYTSI